MKLKGIDLNKLRVFSSVIENKGYRGASGELGMTRSAISQAIAALETQLKKPLFHRNGIQLVPTTEAMLFYEEARRFTSGLEMAFDRFSGKDTSAGGTLRIGAYLEFTRRRLLPLTKRLLEMHPRAQVQFIFDSPSRLEGLLESGKVDMTISIFPQRQNKIKSLKLYQEELCLIARKDLLSKNAKSQEIAQVPVIDYFPTHLMFKRWWRKHFKAPAINIHVAAYAATAEMVLDLVRERCGVGVVPSYLIQNSPDSNVHIIEPSKEKLIDYLWLNQLDTKVPSRLREDFLELIGSLKNFN